MGGHDPFKFSLQWADERTDLERRVACPESQRRVRQNPDGHPGPGSRPTSAAPEAWQLGTQAVPPPGLRVLPAALTTRPALGVH